MEKPLISVIIPSRKIETNTTIPSLQNQTYPNFEIIEEIDEHETGAGATRNRGALKAKGEYLFFCDNDLELEPDCLENLFETLQENKCAGWAFGKFKIDNVLFNQGKKPTPPEDTNSKEFVQYFHGISTMSMIRRDCNPVFDEKLRRYEDWELWIRMTKAGFAPAFCDHILFKTFNRPHGISMSKDADKWIAEVNRIHLKKYADIIIPHHDQHQMLADCLKTIDNEVFNIIVVSGGTFAENCNRGAKIAQTDNLIFLNDDTLPTEDVLTYLAKNEADVCGVAQYIPEMRKTFYGLGYDKGWKLADKIVDVVIPSGFCFKFKKAAWEKLGGLDEKFRNGAEDVDIFLRAIKEDMKFQYIRQYFPHLLSKSGGRFDWAFDNNKIFEERWGSFLNSEQMNIIKNRQIVTDTNSKEAEYEIVSQCVMRDGVKIPGDKVILTPEQYERMKASGCVL